MMKGELRKAILLFFVFDRFFRIIETLFHFAQIKNHFIEIKIRFTQIKKQFAWFLPPFFRIFIYHILAKMKSMQSKDWLKSTSQQDCKFTK